MNNESQIERNDVSREEEAKKEWSNPELKTFGTIAEMTQTFRCRHGCRYPCPICTPKNCATS